MTLLHSHARLGGGFHVRIPDFLPSPVLPADMLNDVDDRFMGEVLPAEGALMRCLPQERHASCAMRENLLTDGRLTKRMLGRDHVTVTDNRDEAERVTLVTGPCVA